MELRVMFMKVCDNLEKQNRKEREKENFKVKLDLRNVQETKDVQKKMLLRQDNHPKDQDAHRKEYIKKYGSVFSNILVIEKINGSSQKH